MGFRSIAVVLVLSVCAWGQGYTVQQIKSFIKSAVELKQPDKQVAETLKQMKMAERLDSDTIETLQSEGAGPKTVAMLKEMATASASLSAAKPPAPPPVYVPPPAPSAEEQAKVLDEVKEYALNYTKSLPDFICLEQTRRYVDTTGKDAWRLEDTVTARLTYFDQKEDYKLVSINDKPMIDASYLSAGGATSTGDFGTTLREVFDSESHTHFDWERWATLRKHRMHVFSFRVPLEYSKYTIRSSESEKDPGQTVTVGYHGEIFVDRDTNMITRLVMEADDIPVTFPVSEAKETLDYDLAKVGDHEFFLPLVADLRMRTARVWSKNIKEFRLYRKFSADAVIKFDGDSLPPLPEDQTKEQPVLPQQPQK